MLIENFSLKYLKKEPLEKSTRKAPLFLLIHGYGSNEKNLFHFVNDLPPSAFVISLQGLHQLEKESFAWYEIEFFEGKKTFNIKQAIESSKHIANFIDKATSYYNLDKENVSILGFSQGAILSYSIALNNPKKVKNIIALSGFFQKEFLNDENQINNNYINNNYKNLNFFISHGKQDEVISIQWAREGKKNLDKYNVTSFYREYEAGHQITLENYNDMINWIKNNF